jgi:nitrate reductase gamma subunit
MFKPQPLATLLAARILGPFLLAAGILLISQRDRMLMVIATLVQDDHLTVMVAFISLAIGLVIITLHDRWGGFTQVVISLLGWITLLRGALLLFVPNVARTMAAHFVNAPQLAPIAGCVIAFLGLWLAFVGFVGRSDQDPGPLDEQA